MSEETMNQTDTGASEAINNKPAKAAKPKQAAQPTLIERAQGYLKQLGNNLKKQDAVVTSVDRAKAIAYSQENMKLSFVVTVLATFATVASTFRQYHKRFKEELGDKFDENLFWRDDKIADEIIKRASSQIDYEPGTTTPKLTKSGQIKYTRDKVISRLASIIAMPIRLGFRSEQTIVALMVKMNLDFNANFALALETVTRGCELFRPVFSTVRNLKYAGLIVGNKDRKQEEFDLYRAIANRAELDGLVSQGATNATIDVVSIAYSFYHENAKPLTGEEVAYVLEQVNVHNAAVRARIQKGEKKGDIPTLLWENVKLAKVNAAGAGTNA